MRTIVAMVLVLSGILSTTAVAGNLCFEGSSLGNNVSVGPSESAACEDPPGVWLNYWVGYGDAVESQCENDPCPPPPGGIDCGCYADTGTFWTISRSSLDPYDNVGPLSSNELYLWMVCVSFHWWTAAEFGLGGSLSVVSFEPLNGFQSLGSGGEILLVHENGCIPDGWDELLVGVIHLDGAVSIPPGLEAVSWSTAKVRYRAN